MGLEHVPKFWLVAMHSSVGEIQKVEEESWQQHGECYRAVWYLVCHPSRHIIHRPESYIFWHKKQWNGRVERRNTKLQVARMEKEDRFLVVCLAYLWSFPFGKIKDNNLDENVNEVKGLKSVCFVCKMEIESVVHSSLGLSRPCSHVIISCNPIATI